MKYSVLLGKSVRYTKVLIVEATSAEEAARKAVAQEDETLPPGRWEVDDTEGPELLDAQAADQAEEVTR